ESFPMTKIDDEHWSGRFPLLGSGLFRAELKSPQGFASKAMKEIRYLAIEDRPPYVTLDRKGTETVLTKPTALPLSIAAFDDYGLDEIRVLVRDLADGEFRSRTLWSAGNKPRTNLNLESTLDEAAA